MRKLGQSYGWNDNGIPDEEQLVQLDDSVPGLPEPVLLGLDVPVCLDDVPLGFLLVLLR